MPCTAALHVTGLIMHAVVVLKTKCEYVEAVKPRS